jgi:hypothetical protein
MGFTNRKKSGNKLISRIVVPGQNMFSVKPGGENKINQQKGKDNNGSN